MQLSEEEKVNKHVLPCELFLHTEALRLTWEPIDI